MRPLLAGDLLARAAPYLAGDVRACVRAVAAGRPARLAWQNEVGGLTFELGAGSGAAGPPAARPDAAVVEMGLPVWRPPAALYLATYGAGRTSSRAAAEVLGLTSR